MPLCCDWAQLGSGLVLNLGVEVGHLLPEQLPERGGVRVVPGAQIPGTRFEVRSKLRPMQFSRTTAKAILNEPRGRGFNLWRPRKNCWLAVAHRPPCEILSSSGAGWGKGSLGDGEKAPDWLPTSCWTGTGGLGAHLGLEKNPHDGWWMEGSLSDGEKKGWIRGPPKNVTLCY